MKIKIHEFAAAELDEAIKWYEFQFEGLGKAFKKAVRSQIRKVADNPTWFLKENENIYKAYIPKFPYKVLFTASKTEVIIWAIAHLHREPKYWKSRIEN